jgi:hypothetical protein
MFQLFFNSGYKLWACFFEAGGKIPETIRYGLVIFGINEIVTRYRATAIVAPDVEGAVATVTTTRKTTVARFLACRQGILQVRWCERRLG